MTDNVNTSRGTETHLWKCVLKQLSAGRVCISKKNSGISFDILSAQVAADFTVDHFRRQFDGLNS